MERVGNYTGERPIGDKSGEWPPTGHALQHPAVGRTSGALQLDNRSVWGDLGAGEWKLEVGHGASGFLMPSEFDSDQGI